MASGYPTVKDTFSTLHADNIGEVIHAQIDNDQSDAINKIENEMGLIPKGVYPDVAARLTALEVTAINVQNVTAYTLVINDVNKCINMINASPSTVTIPLNVNMAWPIGKSCLVRQGSGAGAVTIAGPTGVTILSLNNSKVLLGQIAMVLLWKINTDTWDIHGALQ